eukprot:406441_1
MAELAQQLVYNDNDDTVSEVCVTGGDGRRRCIYNTGRKNDIVIKCIGELRITYHQDIIGHRTMVGTGTIFHVEGDRCFIITAAHNIRTKTHCCNNANCCNYQKQRLKAAPKGSCSGCDFVECPQLAKAKGVQFIRRCIEEKSFGSHEAEYECDMKQNIVSPEYSSWAHPRSGNDICILSINDKDCANFYRGYCKHIYFVNDSKLFNNDTCQMHVFGYPGDKRPLHKAEMWGMSTSNGNDLYVAKNNTNGNKESFVVNKEIDTKSGQSGAGVYCIENNECWICCIHTGGSKSKKENYATLLDSNKLNWIKTSFQNEFNINITAKIKNNKVNKSFFDMTSQELTQWIQSTKEPSAPIIPPDDLKHIIDKIKCSGITGSQIMATDTKLF